MAIAAMLVGGAFVVGVRYGETRRATAIPGGERKVLYYVDPMNPSHTSDKPGLAPCGMKMEPVYADAAPGKDGLAYSGTTTPSALHFTADKQQLVGVRVETVGQQPSERNVRLLGRVVVDETRSYRINASVSGWITKTFPVAVGDIVKRDQVLATFYSPDFLSAGQALLYALNAKDRAEEARDQGKESGDRAVQTAEQQAFERSSQTSRMSQFNLSIQQYVDSLRNLGMGHLQIQEMIRTRKFISHIDICAPAEAMITAREVTEGQRFEKGVELYRLADIRRVWILADLFPSDAQHARAGASVRVVLPNEARSYAAKVSNAVPQFDPDSKTLKLRLEADNPDCALKPGMYVNVEFPGDKTDALIVPADAVVDSGARRTVFVELGNGLFEPRDVEVGWQEHGQVQITSGLMPGERVVTSGTFFLDSESRMKNAAAARQEVALQDVVCGMVVSRQKAEAKGLKSAFEGGSYYFCMAGCKERFDQDPRQYLKAPSPAVPGDDSEAAVSEAAQTLDHHAPKAAVEVAHPAEAGLTSHINERTVPSLHPRDPVCGMNVDSSQASNSKLVVQRGDVGYCFCSEACKRSFESDPGKYLVASGDAHGVAPSQITTETPVRRARIVRRRYTLPPPPPAAETAKPPQAPRVGESPTTNAINARD